MGLTDMENRDIKIVDLTISFPVKDAILTAVDAVSVDFEYNKFTGILGESGCGKSVLGLSILSSLPSYAWKNGSIFYKNIDILTNVKAIPDFYGKEFGFIPQNPSESLNPTRTIEKQMNDILRTNHIKDKEDVIKEQWLCYFGLSNSKNILQSYPHELSGGMLQRVLCAMSLLCKPNWILADEPTKGIDEAMCKTVYRNLKKMKEQADCSMIVITHDLFLAESICDVVAIMYAGEIVEIGTQIFNKPMHPYTKGFLSARPENGLHIMPGRCVSLTQKMMGCKFANRCLYATMRCQKERPPIYSIAGGKVRCFLYA